MTRLILLTKNQRGACVLVTIKILGLGLRRFMKLAELVKFVS